MKIFIACALFQGGSAFIMPGAGLQSGGRASLQMSMGHFLTAEQKAELRATAEAIATPGKGITATDEGPGTIGLRFEGVGIENTEERRRAYRQILYETPGVNDYLSAAILDPETIYQKSTTDGSTFPERLTALGIVPGVKPHLKVATLPGTNGATVMQGLDSLGARCKEYYDAGCRFAKWRSPMNIVDGQIPDLAIEANMQDLARYALICQSEGLMPIVEPDISLQGDFDLETAIEVNVKVQACLYKAMLDHGVWMEGTTLKPNMVNCGLKCPKSYTVDELGEATVTVLRRCFPAAMPGANFLSGGQNLENAAARLNAINKAKGNSPWNLSFSWSFALQMPLLQMAEGKDELPLEEMAELYLKELKVASAAALGEYDAKPGEGDHVPPTSQGVVASREKAAA